MKERKAINAAEIDFSKMGAPVDILLKNVNEALADPNLPEHHKKQFKAYKKLFEEISEAKKK